MALSDSSCSQTRDGQRDLIMQLDSGIENQNGDLIEPSVTEHDILVRKVSALETERTQLIAAKEAAEQGLGQKRAAIKRLFVLKEEEIKKLENDVSSLRSRNQELQTEVSVLHSEVADLKVAAQILQNSKHEETQRIQERLEEEIASLQTLLRSAVSEAEDSTATKFEKERETLLRSHERLEEELQAMREKLTERVNTDSSNTQSGRDKSLFEAPMQLFKKVKNTWAETSSDEELENSMRKAQEDSDLLKSIVIPLEREIADLRLKLRMAEERALESHTAESSHIPGASPFPFENESACLDNTGDTDSISNYLDYNDSVSVPSLSPDKRPVSPGFPALISLRGEPMTRSASSHALGVALCQSDGKCGNAHLGQIAKASSLNNVVQSSTHVKDISLPETETFMLQKQLKEANAKIENLQKSLSEERLSAENIHKHRIDLEQQWLQSSSQAQKQLEALRNKIVRLETEIKNISKHYNDTISRIRDHLGVLTTDRENIQKELRRLQEENDDLVGKHSKHSQQLQSEQINLPQTIEELQLALLRSHEEVITAAVGKERAEETLNGELVFLRQQLQAEQHERANMEESLTKEISSLQDQLAVQNSISSELERKMAIERERDQNREAQKTDPGLKGKMEDEICFLKAKIQSLQHDLDNSEDVQRDLVKLSQSLQVQLEELRHQHREVRWQFEDDVFECNGCKREFGKHLLKTHCLHCGRIFCQECTTKSVASGPCGRPARVCNVCHTLLQHDATPYFSIEAPPV